MASVFRGEPYRIAGHTIHHSIRAACNVEDESGDEVTIFADFSMYANYTLGILPGDEVEIRAKRFGSRNIIQSIYCCSTGHKMRGEFSVPAWMIRFPLYLLMALIILFACGVIWILVSGLTAVLLTMAVLAAVPPAVMAWAYRKIAGHL